MSKHRLEVDALLVDSFHPQRLEMLASVGAAQADPDQRQQTGEQTRIETCLKRETNPRTCEEADDVFTINEVTCAVTCDPIHRTCTC